MKVHKSLRYHLLVLLLCVCWAGAGAQNQTVSIHMKNASLKQVFKAIESQTTYRFSYRSGLIDNRSDITLNRTKASVPSVLNEALKGRSLKYSIVSENSIVITDPAAPQSSSPSSPTQSVKGKVVDANGEPVVGAVIKVGTKVSAITDIDGYFSFEGNENDVLEISSIGFMTKNVIVKGQNSLDITLNDDTKALDEVVVVGYEVQRKKDLTGAVGVLKVKDVNTTPVSSVDQMMEGKLSGVNVMPDNMPGGGVAVRVRGFSTIRNNDPLYIIDGIPVENGINFLNPNDIESMQVLKDASSASIYGARAANGVVIITTKKGTGEKVSIRFDGYIGIQSASKRQHMLNAQEFGDMLWQAMKNDGKTPTSTIYGNGATPVIPQYIDKDNKIPSDDVDWVDEILRSAAVQSYNLTLSKADTKSNMLFSLGYFNQAGIIKYTGFQRLNGRFNSEWRLFKDYVVIGENMSVSHDWGVTINNNAALGGTMYKAYQFESIIPVYDNTGEFAGNPFSDIENPMGYLYRNKDNNRRNTRFVGSGYLQVQPIKGIIFRSTFGADYKSYYRRAYDPKYDEIQVMRTLSTLTNNHSYRFNWVFTNTLNLTKNFGEHHLNALLGMESLRSHYEWFEAARKGFPYDAENFRYLGAGDTSTQTNDGSYAQYSMVSYFGKLDYNYADRYLAALTVRRDGTSRLDKNKWGNFPAVSLGWRISSEPFFHSKVIDNLKLRFGYGQNGNSDIPAYSTIDSYSSNQNYSNYPIDGKQTTVHTGYTQTRNSNPNLKWETTTQTNIGIDLGFFDNILNVTVDYFNKNTKDLLYARPLVATVGGTNSTVWDNVGKMNNKGIEAEISYRNQVNKDFGFNVAFNISHIKNEITELAQGISYIGIPASSLHGENFDQEISRTAVGHPLASFYVYKENGLFQTQDEINAYTNKDGQLLQPNAKPGDMKFVDMNHDGVIDGNDRDFVGSPHPNLTTGLTLGVNYKNLDLAMFFSGSFGNDVYNLTKYLGDFYNQSQYNKSKNILDAWRTDHTNTRIPRVSQDDLNNNIRPSTYYISNGSFVRLKSVKLGYTLPKSLFRSLGLENGYIYIQATNLFTITEYEGIDPEVGLQSYESDHRNLDIGIDRGVYPLSRTFTFGVNFSF